PAPAKRPTEVTNANALPRHSVEYCSGSQIVYTAKLAPPRPRRNRIAKNGLSAPGWKNMYPNPSEIEKNMTPKYRASVVGRPSRSASVGTMRQPMMVPNERTIVPYDASVAARGTA